MITEQKLFDSEYELSKEGYTAEGIVTSLRPANINALVTKPSDGGCP